MKALRFERKSAAVRRGHAWPARWRPARGASVGPLRLADIDPPELPGPGWVRHPPPPGRHLRQRPRHHRRPRQPLLRADRVASRSCPATRWSADTRRRPPRSCSNRCSAASPAASSPPCAGLRPGRPRQLRAPRLRPPRARPADRLLLRHRRRLVAPRMVAHESQLHAVPDDLDRRGRGHGRADRLRHPRRPAPPACRDGDARRRARRRHARPAHHRRPAAATTAPARIVAAAKLPRTSSRLARALGADDVVRARRARPGSCAGSPGSPWRTATQLTGGADVVIDCVGTERLDRRRRLAVVRPRRPGRAGGHARPASRSTSPALWHREIAARRRLRLRHRDAARRRRARRTFDLAFELVPPADLGRLVSATYPLRRLRRRHHPRRRRRPPRRRARSPSTSASRERETEPLMPTPRLRPRRRPLDAAHRCSGTARASASRSCPPAAAGSSTRPSRWPRSTTSTAPSATRCSNPIDDATRCRRCCSRA